jgi:hypothetical protein
LTKPRSQSRAHIDKNAEQATARAMERVAEFSNSGDEEAFVKQIKEVFPGISGPELLQKIVLFRELKRTRTRGGS